VTPRWWLGVAGALAVAFWGGTQVAGTTVQRAGDTGAATSVTRTPVAAHAAPAAPPPRGLTRDDLRDDVRAILRDELARKASSSDGSIAPLPVPDTAAVSAAHAAVSGGIARGRWSAADRTALRAQLIQLGPAETHDVLAPLFQAINAQQLELDGPPI
jgi:hypothetical protein